MDERENCTGVIVNDAAVSAGVEAGIAPLKRR
jgi:hypothetical protein